MAKRAGAASALFSPEERAAVEAAVREAEQRTAAEIVTVVAAQSARHRRGVDLAGTWLAFLSLAGLAIFSPDHQIDGIEALVAFVLALAIGAIAADMIPPLKRLFVPRWELEEAAADGAMRAFLTFGVGQTERRNGLLIYVSLFERTAIVMGDKKIGEVLSAQDYAAIRDILLGGLKRGKTEEALTAAVRKAGELLGSRLPRDAGDRSELGDTLRLLD